MAPWIVLNLILVIHAAFDNAESSDFLDEYNEIHRTILGDKYDPTVIPWSNNEPLAVNTSFKLEYIINLTEKDQILTSVIWNSFEWYDSRLTWDPSQLYGVESIRLLPEMVWTPGRHAAEQCGNKCIPW